MSGEGKPPTCKWLAAAAFTVTVALPVMELVALSVAVTVLLPAVFKVIALVKVCMPASAAVKV